MGLVGSLDDLGLGDILQIISLSRKSGVLHLKSSKGVGTIVFCDGLIRRSVLKGGTGSLGELLVASGLVNQEQYAEALAEAQASGGAIESVLSQRLRIPEEKIEELRRHNVEQAVIQMFQWTDGDFSFDVEETDVSADPALALSKGINAQYLAMEGSRISDEASMGGGAEAASSQGGEEDPFSFASIGEEVRASEAAAPVAEAPPVEVAAAPAAPVQPDPVVAAPEPIPAPAPVVAAPAPAVEAAPAAAAVATDPGSAEAHSVAEPVFADMADILDESLQVEAVDPVASPAQIPVAEVQADVADAPSPGSSSPGTIVVADPDRVVGEWVKTALAQVVQRVHIFNDLDPAMQRARQYLTRGEIPMVVFAGNLPGSESFAKRLQKMSPRMRLIALSEPGHERPFPEGIVEALLQKPSAGELKATGDNPKCAGLAKALLRSIAG